ncbi:MAG: hypothetical protein DWQ05_18875 [Calditrichaeota bacterium]|nr:MAG: hypothetical protein DWQ05_18875 [Calditrichota bacterium]
MRFLNEMIQIPVCTFIFIWVYAVNVSAGEIKGVVLFSPQSVKTQARQTMPRYPHGKSRELPMHGIGNTTQAVVYITGKFPDSTFSTPDTQPIMDQRDEQFIPYILPVLAGTTVNFPNNDRVYHNIFSFSKAKTFDLGKYPTKTSKKVKFDQTGVVKVYCEIHAHMNAFILVLPNPYYSVVNQDGKFSIPDVPAGTYQLKIFTGRGTESEKKIIVNDNRTTLVEFSL